MRTKTVKRIFTVALSATMVMGMSTTAFASDPSTSVEAPIYSFDVQNVVVPTTFATAFNPDELDVKIDSTNTSNAQVLSKSYGILNKSSKDKIVTVSLNVTDKNTDKITFVKTAADITNAKKDTYTVFLKAVPADSTEVKISGASADKDTAAAALGDVTMAPATGNEVTLKAGENQMAFKLDKATYTPKSGSEVTLGTSTSNDVANNYEITAVAAAGKGITAFKFDGSLNKNTDWTKLTNGIEIKAVYTFENADAETVISGTGAMVQVDQAPTFSTGTDVGTITYTAGTGAKALKTIKTITMDYNGTDFDGYNAVANWQAATDVSGVITFDSPYINAYAEITSDNEQEATVTYETQGGETKTATVDVKLR